VWLNEYETLDDARRGIGGYVVDRYHDRPHSGLDYRTPLEVRPNLGRSTKHRGLT
jgi:putative transposase